MFIIGKVVKAQGIKGEVKTEVLTSFPEHFEHLSEVYIKQNELVKYAVENTRFSRNFVFIKFKEIQSRDDAENLKNKFLYIPDDELYPLENDEFYHHQLVGLKVYDEANSYIGLIKNIETYAGKDVLVVESENKETYLIPVVKNFIRKVDIKSQKVTIHVIEGLLG